MRGWSWQEAPFYALLDCLNETCGLNGVIVLNDLLADYIRQKKPGLKLVCSRSHLNESTEAFVKKFNKQRSMMLFDEIQNNFR